MNNTWEIGIRGGEAIESILGSFKSKSITLLCSLQLGLEDKPSPLDVEIWLLFSMTEDIGEKWTMDLKAVKAFVFAHTQCLNNQYMDNSDAK